MEAYEGSGGNELEWPRNNGAGLGADCRGMEAKRKGKGEEWREANHCSVVHRGGRR